MEIRYKKKGPPTKAVIMPMGSSSGGNKPLAITSDPIKNIAPINDDNKISFLKKHPALKDVEAIKNNRLYVVRLADLSPGIRNPMLIEQMYHDFYEAPNIEESKAE